MKIKHLTKYYKNESSNISSNSRSQIFFKIVNF